MGQNPVRRKQTMECACENKLENSTRMIQYNNELRHNALWVWTGGQYSFFIVVSVKSS